MSLFQGTTYTNRHLMPLERTNVRRLRRQPVVSSVHVGRTLDAVMFGRAASVIRWAFSLTKAQPRKNFFAHWRFVALLVVMSAAAVTLGLTVFSSNYSTHTAFASPAQEEADYTLSGPASQNILEEFELLFKDSESLLVSESTLAARTALISRYLEEWNSPLAEFSKVIAEQPHWKRILAISFAESGLGKHCADNNCSGIGVEPGHPLWHTYETKGEWVKSMNRLLERRYKDWPLEKMNGVYNQPGSANWIAATKQIMLELDARGIE